MNTDLMVNINSVKTCTAYKKKKKLHKFVVLIWYQYECASKSDRGFKVLFESVAQTTWDLLNIKVYKKRKKKEH